MKLHRILMHDIVEGIVKSFYKYLVVVIIAAIQVYGFSQLLVTGYSEDMYSSPVTISDYVAYVMQGTKAYIFDPHETFQLPVFWFAFQIGISYIIAYYPEKDFRYYGKMTLIACKSRSSWWSSKCIWCILNVLIYFGVAFGVTMLLAIMLGAKPSFSFSEDILMTFFNTNVQYVSFHEMVLLIYILPCLMTIAISLLQILMSFMVTPVISFAMVCSLYVLSAYYTNSFVVGNYTIWQRSSYIDTIGVDPVVGLFLAAILGIASMLVGNIYFEKCDVF